MVKKILFWLSADLTYFFLAYHFQKIPNCEIYAIIDITDKPKKFFENQKLVNFKKIWFFHDNIKDTKNRIPDLEYLKSFEEEYNIDLWKLAINERVIYRFYNFHRFSSNEILNIEEQSCKLFENVLQEINPDFIVSMDPKFHHLEIFYEMCLKKEITFLMPSYPNIGFRAIISQIYNTPDNINEINFTKSQNRNFQELQNYIKKLNLREQYKEFDEVFGGKIIEKINAGIDFFIKSNNSNEKNHYNYYGRTKSKVLAYTIENKLDTVKRKKFIDATLEKFIPKNKLFVYYPLGVDMEKSTLIQSPIITNQIEIIRQIAKSIPIDFTLFVKEHQGQISRGWRSIQEYKEIMDIPNVRLFHPDVSNEEMLTNCSLVATIGGTSGFEAAVYQKPSIVFSNAYYGILPSVIIVDKISELPKIIRNAIKINVNSDDVDRYLTFYENNSFSFDYAKFGIHMMNHFYRAGNLVDVEITEEQIKSFLINHNYEIQIMLKEFLKKMNLSS